jgi:hypothetical protein
LPTPKVIEIGSGFHKLHFPSVGMDFDALYIRMPNKFSCVETFRS